MGRSVSYPSAAQVVTFKSFHPETCDCSDPTSALSEEDRADCTDCGGTGYVGGINDSDDFDMLIDAFRDHLKHLFPSVVAVDEWIDREDHVLAENGLARFGMSEYCGLVAYWIVPKEDPYDRRLGGFLAKHWISRITDKFVAAFGELSKVGSMSNGEGVYRRIDKSN